MLILCVGIVFVACDNDDKPTTAEKLPENEQIEKLPENEQIEKESVLDFNSMTTDEIFSFLRNAKSVTVFNLNQAYPTKVEITDHSCVSYHFVDGEWRCTQLSFLENNVFYEIYQLESDYIYTKTTKYDPAFFGHGLSVTSSEIINELSSGLIRYEGAKLVYEIVGLNNEYEKFSYEEFNCTEFIIPEYIGDYVTLAKETNIFDVFDLKVVGGYINNDKSNTSISLCGGETVLISPEDKEGMKFIKWIDNNGKVVSLSNEYILQVNNDYEITALFAPIDENWYMVTVVDGYIGEDIDFVQDIVREGTEINISSSLESEYCTWKEYDTEEVIYTGRTIKHKVCKDIILESFSTAIKSEQFFNDLWAASNSIGSTKIKADDNIGFTADMALKVKIKDKKTTYKEIDLGIALQLVLDRTNEGKNSAAKIKLYNADTKTNWITLYYFLNDPDFIYIDYQEKNIKFNFNFCWNDQIPGMFNDVLNIELFKGTSVLDSVEEITETTGAEFNLNNLVNTILGIVKEAAGFDISTLINDNKSLLEDTLGIKGIVDSNGNVNLQAIFNSSIIRSFFKKSNCVTQTDGSKAYSTDIVLSKTITGALSGLFGDFGPIFNGIGINLSFNTTASGAIDGFKIAVDLPGLQGTEANLGKPMYFAREISINELEFIPINTAKASDYLGIDTSKYNGDVAIDFALELDSKGITITPNAIDPNGATKNAPASVSLDGKYVLGIQGNMDLSKLDEEGNCYLYVFLEKVGTGAKPVEIFYNGEKIILTYDASVKTADDKSIVASIINSVGKLICDAMDDVLVANDEKDTKVNPLIGTVLEEKEGYLKFKEDAPCYLVFNLNFRNLLNYIVNMEWNMPGSNSDADEAYTECQYPFTMNKLATIVNDVITALNTEDGLGGALPGKTIAEIIATWFKWDKRTLPVRTETEREVLYARAIAYNQNWFETFMGLGFFQDAKYTDYNSLTKADTELMWAYATGKLTYSDYKVVVVEGVVTEAVFNNAMADLNVYFGDKVIKFAACPEAHWTEAVFNYLKTASVNISLDNGFVVTITIGMDATTQARLELSVNANTSLTREAMKAVYDAKAAEITTANELDLGEVVFGIDDKGIWYASGDPIKEKYTSPV